MKQILINLLGNAFKFTPPKGRIQVALSRGSDWQKEQARRGVGCSSCHGRIDQMEVVHQAMPLSMGWCLDCHTAPIAHLRPTAEERDENEDRFDVEVHREILADWIVDHRWTTFFVVAIWTALMAIGHYDPYLLIPAPPMEGG